jgi:signal transduction histidine kinase/DNA-binding response OmpR family regulator
MPKNNKINNGNISYLARLGWIFIVICLRVSIPSIASAQTTLSELAETARKAQVKQNNDSAIYYADKAIALILSQPDTAALLKAMRVKGKALFAQKKHKEAVDLYFAALRLCSSPNYAKEKALLYGELGYAYYNRNQGKEAKQYYRQQIEIFRALQGEDSLGNYYINLAVAHQRLKEFDSSRLILDRVKAILNRIKDSTMWGYYYINMGANYTYIDKPDSANLCNVAASAIWKALGNESQLFRATFNIGFYQFQKNNFTEAIKYYQQSLAAAQKFAGQRDIAHLYGTMAESYAAVNDYKNAYNSLYLYATINDSFYNADINSYVLKLDKQYQTEQNKATIQAQQLELNISKLAIEKHRNTILWVVVIAVLLLSAGAGVFVYLNFRQKVKQQVEEAKTRFFANVAHEIRTPLSMIQGPIEILQKNNTDPAMAQQLSTAARNTQRLNDLINQMLDISKIDAVRYTLHESVGSITDFVQQLCQQYQIQAAEKNISFVCNADADVPNVLFDKDVIEKILNNLAGNAIKYTPNGGSAGVDMTLSAISEAMTLTINVWDNGPGIPMEEQNKIFERFYRSSTAGKSGIKGVGIGLSLSADLARLLHGSLSVTSTPDKGSVFTLVCPLHIAQQATTTQVNESAFTLLLIEDDKDILEFNTGIMTDEGYNVIAVSNGTDAANMLTNSLPDLIVTDLMMPGKDGNELLKDIRNNTLTAHIPVIILSAKAAAQSRIDGTASGAQAYLAKPYSPTELVALVKNQLSIVTHYKERYQNMVADTQQNVEDRFSGTDPFTQRCYTIIQEQLDDPQLSVEKLAELMNINRSHFQRKIKTLTGFSPSELIRKIRLEKALEILLSKQSNITETAYATGFTSQSYFTKCFTEHFGYPPSQAGTDAAINKTT